MVRVSGGSRVKCACLGVLALAGVGRGEDSQGEADEEATASASGAAARGGAGSAGSKVNPRLYPGAWTDSEVVAESSRESTLSSRCVGGSSRSSFELTSSGRGATASGLVIYSQPPRSCKCLWSLFEDTRRRRSESPARVNLRHLLFTCSSLPFISVFVTLQETIMNKVIGHGMHRRKDGAEYRKWASGDRRQIRGNRNNREAAVKVCGLDCLVQRLRLCTRRQVYVPGEGDAALAVGGFLSERWQSTQGRADFVRGICRSREEDHRTSAFGRRSVRLEMIVPVS